MRIAVVGSRDFPRLEEVSAFVRRLPKGTTLVSGGARGVDTAAEEAARSAGIPVEVHEAEWDRHGRRAGPLRNTRIVQSSDVVVAFWDGRSPGTADTLRKARLARRPVRVFYA